MKETAGMSYDDLKDAVLMGLGGKMVGLAGIIENWDMLAV